MLSVKHDFDITNRTSSLIFDDSGTQITLFTYINGNIIIDSRDFDNTISEAEFLSGNAGLKKWVYDIRQVLGAPVNLPTDRTDAKIDTKNNSIKTELKLGRDKVQQVEWNKNDETLTTKKRPDPITMSWYEF